MIYEKLLEAQKALQGVGKGSNNSFHNYNYTSEKRCWLHVEKLCIRQDWPALEKAGKLLATNTIQPLRWSNARCGYLKLEGILDSQFHYPICPGNGRPLDKAVSAALTTGLSYWLRDLLLLPRIDGLEVDTRDDQNWNPEQERLELLADEIHQIATEEQLEKLLAEAQKKYKCSELKHLPPVTLKAWHKRVIELSKENTKWSQISPISAGLSFSLKVREQIPTSLTTKFK